MAASAVTYLENVLTKKLFFQKKISHLIILIHFLIFNGMCSQELSV